MAPFAGQLDPVLRVPCAFFFAVVVVDVTPVSIYEHLKIPAFLAKTTKWNMEMERNKI